MSFSYFSSNISLMLGTYSYFTVTICKLTYTEINLVIFVT